MTGACPTKSSLPLLNKLFLLGLSRSVERLFFFPDAGTRFTFDPFQPNLYYRRGSACGLVSAWDFKSYGPDFIGTVGSIPTHFRQCLTASQMNRANLFINPAIVITRRTD